MRLKPGELSFGTKKKWEWTTGSLVKVKKGLSATLTAPLLGVAVGRWVEQVIC